MSRLRRYAAVASVLLVATCTSGGTIATSPPAPVGAATGSVVAIATASPAVATLNASRPDGTATVQMAEHFFDPPLLTVRVGTTATWKNVGIQTHDVHARDGSFNSVLLGPGGTFAFTFTKPGRYPYFCAPHEGDGMVGVVEVH